MKFEDGEYTGTIVDWGINKAKTGTLQFFVVVEIDRAVKRTIFRAITQATIDYVIQDLERLDYTYEGFDQLDRGHPQAIDFTGIEIPVVCENEMYEGKPKERWSFGWGGGGVQQIASSDEISKLTKDYASAFQCRPKANGKVDRRVSVPGAVARTKPVPIRPAQETGAAIRGEAMTEESIPF